MFRSPVTEPASTRPHVKQEPNFSVTLYEGGNKFLTCRRENNVSPCVKV